MEGSHHNRVDGVVSRWHYW